MLLALGATLVVCGSAVAVVVGADDDNTTAQTAAKNSATARGTHQVVQSWGVDPAAAKPAFERDGHAVSIARSAQAACLLRDDENDHCYSRSNVASGLGYSITNDCTAGGNRQMLVRGFGPAGASAVEVVYSDGSTPLKAELADGAFFITATTPQKGESYPATIRYVDAGGSELKSSPIRGGQDLCLGQ